MSDRVSVSATVRGALRLVAQRTTIRALLDRKSEMRKLLTFLIALGAIVFGVCSPASAQFNGCGPGLCAPGSIYAFGYGFQGECGGYNSACASAPTSPSYSSLGGVTDGGSGSSSITVSANIGTAASSRVVLIAAARQNGGFSSVTLNGIACTSVVADTAFDSQFWACTGSSYGSGLQSVVLTGGISEFRAAQVWLLTNLNSTIAKQTASNSGSGTTVSINVTSGDFLFANASENASALNFNGSTQTPANTYNNNAGWQNAADWTATSSNPSFSVVASGAVGLTAVTFH